MQSLVLIKKMKMIMNMKLHKKVLLTLKIRQMKLRNYFITQE